MSEDEYSTLQNLLDKLMDEEGRCPTCGSPDFVFVYGGDMSFLCDRCDEQWGFGVDEGDLDESDDDLEEPKKAKKGSSRAEDDEADDEEIEIVGFDEEGDEDDDRDA